MKLNLTLSAALLATTAPVYAQDIIELDEITVTAGYTDTNISDTGASVSVLQSDDLNAATTSIVQTFETVPGVSVSASGGLGGTTNVKMRGLSQEYIAVRVDGMDISDPSGTQVSYDFGGLNGMGYGQVEFLKGSQSAIFGSEAVAGVVSLKTLSSSSLGQRGSLNLEMGSYGTIAAGLRFENVTDQGAAAISMSHVETNGFSAKNTGAGKDEADAYSGDQLRISLDHNLGKNLYIALSMLKMSEEIEYDGYITPLEDKTLRDTSSIRGAIGFSIGNTNHEVAFTSGQFDRTTNTDTYVSSRNELEYQGNVEVGATSITIGASRQVEQMDVSTQYSTDSGNATDKAIFVETITSLTDLLSVSAAARRTTSNDFGTNSSYRVSGVYNLTDTLILRAIASSGFRAPSLYERFSTDYGNPDLEVEKSSTQEIGIEQTYASGSAVRLTLFKSKVDNLIDYKITDFDTYDGFYDQVDGSVKSEGIELSGEYKLNDALTFAGSYTYVESKNGKTRLNRIPGHDIALSLKTKLNPRTNADVTINHIKDYYDFGVKLPDYTVVNLSASYDVTDTLQGYVRVQNLMDADYETITDYNTGGRQMFAGVRASF